MATLEGFRVRNFGVLKDVTLGRLWHRKKEEALTPMTAVKGKIYMGRENCSRDGRRTKRVAQFLLF